MLGCFCSWARINGGVEIWPLSSRVALVCTEENLGVLVIWRVVSKGLEMKGLRRGRVMEEWEEAETKQWEREAAMSVAWGNWLVGTSFRHHVVQKLPQLSFSTFFTFVFMSFSFFLVFSFFFQVETWKQTIFFFFFWSSMVFLLDHYGEIVNKSYHFVYLFILNLNEFLELKLRKW